ncbi:MAG: UDP-N-acetylmuramoyl-L-alanine--D-glutamate ligase [Methylophilaceae bacterium]|nr:UDP-N-acetylmuramoyl-L-alanine--D-glutamate ligase [Methylophilaceae bacterium]
MRFTLKDKQVLVLGLGETGLSVLRWLRRHEAILSVADTRAVPPGLAMVQTEMPEVSLHVGAFTEAVFAQAEIIVASPGIAIDGPLAEPLIQAAIARGIPVVGDVELFAQYKSNHAKVIAISGANGKTTVTTLVGEMCRAAGLKTVVAGNIGLPVLDALVEAELSGETPDVYVLELSSFQLETTFNLQADVATVLNVTEDHMDRYAGMAEYAAAKARIFQGGGVQVLNRQDAISRGMALTGRKEITFGSDLPPSHNDFGLMQVHGDVWLMHGNIELIKTSELYIAGLHNACNALAALALCRAIGLDYLPLLQALRNFKGLPHRVEWVAKVSGVDFFDDSKGTNVGATIAALTGLVQKALPHKVVLIAGGDGKGQDFSLLQEAVKQNARSVVLIGRDGAKIEQALQVCNVPLIGANSLEDAVSLAFASAQAGDVVLLSPACASFDMFRNYEHRAEVFVTAVKALSKNTGRNAE